MPVVEVVQSYSSPRHKLLQFFISSRDGWKEKCRQGKIALKRMTNRSVFLQRSRDRWKELARQREQELNELRREVDAQKRSPP